MRTALVALALGACAAPITEPRALPEAVFAAPDDDPGDLVCDETVAERAQPFDAADCFATCVGIGTMGCASALAACWLVDAITLGSITIPCSVVSVVACTGGVGVLPWCKDICGAP
jgi:hypothetical protein